MSPPSAVLAVDGGNSKSELVLVAADGAVLAHRRGPTMSHQAIATETGSGPREAADAGMRWLARATREALDLPADGGVIADIGLLCLAGADFASDERLLAHALRRQGLVEAEVILNDAFAPLRAGSDRPYGISVICGAGVNAAAIAPDGRTARFPALGAISGDWGGSSGIGLAGLMAAVRARDGRGPSTSLADLVPLSFGLKRPSAVTLRLYDGRIAEHRLRELAPVVLDAANEGDRVATEIVERLAEELATMAVALGRRMRMSRLACDVVLAGGVFATKNPRLVELVRARIGERMPRAHVKRLVAPPVLGAALLGFDRLGTMTPAIEARLRSSLISRS